MRSRAQEAEPDTTEMPEVETTLDLYQEHLAKPIEATKGRFVGKAYDAKSGKPLVGVGIQIEETGDLTLTDDKGRFIIDQVEPGTYTIIISQGGYRPMRAENVTITSGQVSSLASANGGLERAAVETSDELYEMDEIEVVAELVEEGGESDLFDRQEMRELVSMVGKEEFTRTGSSNVGDALKSQSGTNVQDGKYAVIRGLGDRYSNTTLNSAYIPSADPSRKAVQLDLIPTHLVKRLLTYKVFTPDLPGEFSGGAIDIQTIRFPDELAVKVSVGEKYGENTTGKEMLVNRDRRMDLLGETSDGLPNDIPDAFAFRGLGVRTTSDPPSAAQLEAQRVWKAVHGAGSTRPTTRDAELGRSWSVSYGNSHETDVGLIGMVLAANHETDSQIIQGREINRGAKLFNDEFGPTQTQVQDSYKQETNWGILGNLSWRPNEDHEVSLTALRYTAAADQVKQGRRIGTSEKGSVVNPVDGLPGAVVDYQGFTGRGFQAFDEISYVYRSQDTVQLEGDHNFGLLNSGIKVDWILSNSDAIEDRPDQRILPGYQVDYADASLPAHPNVSAGDLNPSLGSVFTAANVLGGNISSPFREYLTTEETLWQVKGDVSIPVWERDEKHKFEVKTGYSFSNRERQVRGRLFTYDYGGSLTRQINDSESNFGVDFIDNFDSDQFITGQNQRSADWLAIDDLTIGGNTVRNVDAFSHINATYLMGNFTWGGLELTGGARFEREIRSYEVIRGLNSNVLVDQLNPEEDESNSHILPAFSAKYTFGEEDNHIFRFGYGRTIARPTFYEYAPIRTADQTTGDEIRGNEALIDTVIDNFDLRYEYFPDPGELIAVSLFHKKMESPIVSIVQNTSGSGSFKSWQNSPSGFIQGIELEYQKQFLDYFTFTTNGTYIRSEIEGVTDSRGVSLGSGTVFEGQPEWIFNARLSFDYPDWGLQTNLNYNYVSEVLTNVSADPRVSNIFQRGVHSLDFVASKEFGDGWKLKMSIKNLLDSKREQFYEGEDLVYDGYSTGRTFGIGLSYDY
ncbi:MAG: outer membrane beta-barrel protein [Verrucomicrobiales bacterium]